MIPACLCPRNCGVPREAPGRAYAADGGRMRIAGRPPFLGGASHQRRPGQRGGVFHRLPSGLCVLPERADQPRARFGAEVTPQGTVQGLFFLMEQGAHNINLVTPTHFVPQIRQALQVKKLPVPVVYNTSGYEKVETLKALEGLVDIYLPDYKYDDPVWQICPERRITLKGPGGHRRDGASGGASSVWGERYAGTGRAHPSFDPAGPHEKLHRMPEADQRNSQGSPSA